VLAHAGNDRVLLGAGNDRTYLGLGDDYAEGGLGNDRILANQGRDVTDGGDGDDDLWALVRTDVTGPRDIAGDVVRGAAGNDTIHVRDGELDVVSCSPGFDVARLDFADVTESATAAAPNGNCERVRRAAPRPRGDTREGEG
jgi:Ca2+-binding RTX toxin-like protein